MSIQTATVAGGRRRNQRPETADSSGNLRCRFHPSAPAVSQCRGCAWGLCDGCVDREIGAFCGPLCSHSFRFRHWLHHLELKLTRSVEAPWALALIGVLIIATIGLAGRQLGNLIEEVEILQIAVEGESVPIPAAEEPAPPPADAIEQAVSAEAGPSSERRLPRPPDFSTVSGAGNRLALTLDGGWRTEGVDRALDLLHREGLTATLFLTSRFIRARPDLAQRALAEGHEIGNHTATHSHLTTYRQDRRQRTAVGVDREMLQSELIDADRALIEATGHGMAPLWRAPYGEENAEIRRWAEELGYLHLRWSFDAWDWVDDRKSRMYESPERLARRFAAGSDAGGILMMHLYSERSHPVWSSLPELSRLLRSKELQFVPASRLFAASERWRSRFDRSAAARLEAARSLGAERLAVVDAE